MALFRKWFYEGKLPTFWRPFKIASTGLKAENIRLDLTVGNREYSEEQRTNMPISQM
jgi:hypothetical protein